MRLKCGKNAVKMCGYLSHVSPAVAAHPLPLAPRAFVLPKTALLALIGRHAFPLLKIRRVTEVLSLGNLILFRYFLQNRLISVKSRIAAAIWLTRTRYFNNSNFKRVLSTPGGGITITIRTTPC